MLAKLCIVIMAVTLTAASLLTVRQQRLDAVYDMSRSIERAAGHDRQLQEVRIDIARRVTPQSVQTLAGRIGLFEAIPLEWCDPVLAVMNTARVQDPAEVALSGPMQGVGEDEREAGDESGGVTLGPAFEIPEPTR